ncbi:decarboxylase [Lithospermum erythrorhizon]|uniref:Decarboxylase n=1 Tax=Lithospermum erythrorhizon TaxID=34254 RepID=A0AAV3P0A3_LITER
MGHESSKLTDSVTDDSSSGKKPSKYREKVKTRRIGRHASGATTLPHQKHLNKEDFAGIVLLRLITAEMKFKDKDNWLACISFGEQRFCTQTSVQTKKPIWNEEKKLLLERQGAHTARISVFETNRLSKNNLVGCCEIDVFEFVTQDSTSDHEVLDLLDPSNTATVVGTISVSCSVEDPIETVKSFARRILSIVDYEDDGELSFTEFSDLINAFGNQLAADKKEELFKAADIYGNGVAILEELAMLLAVQQER